MPRYTNELLDSLRLISDPAPDYVIHELVETGQLDNVNRVLRELITNNQTIPSDLPDNIEHWLRETSKLPEGTDTARLDRAAQFFVDHGVTIALILATASFVECYAAHLGVKVMTTTYRLGQNPYRRVAETAQFLMLVMKPGGLTNGDGEAIAAIQKVRLMHCAIRHYILQTGQWDVKRRGEPICQEDMLGTVACLSYVVLDCMKKLGIDYTEQEAEDYIYLWRIVGEMLGCMPEYLPNTVAEAKELTEAIRRHAHGPSEDGRIMTQALVEMHANLIPGQMLDGLMPALMRYLTGDQVADYVGLPRSHWDGLIKNGPALAKFLDTLDDGGGVLADLVDKLGLSFISRKTFELSNYQRAAFTIPTSLRDAWHLDEKAS